MSPERLTPEDMFLGGIIGFVNLMHDSKSGLLESYNIKGESSDDDTSYGGFVGIWRHADPKNTENPMVNAFPRVKNKRNAEKAKIELLCKVLMLELPKKVKNFQPRNRNGQQSNLAAEQTSLKFGMPYAVIGFGRDKTTGKEMITMFAVADQTPQKALREMKLTIHSRICLN